MSGLASTLSFLTSHAKDTCDLLNITIYITVDRIYRIFLMVSLWRKPWLVAILCPALGDLELHPRFSPLMPRLPELLCSVRQSCGTELISASCGELSHGNALWRETRLQSKGRAKGAIYTGGRGGGTHPLLVQIGKAYVACSRQNRPCDNYAVQGPTGHALENI